MSMNERRQLEAQAVLDVIKNPDVAQTLRQRNFRDNYNVRRQSISSHNIHLDLHSSLQFTLEQITALYTFSQFQHSYGNYIGAADYLYHFRVLSTDNELNNSAHRGKLASDILTCRWEVEKFNTLRDAIDSRYSRPTSHTCGSSTGRSSSISTAQRRGSSSSRRSSPRATSTPSKHLAPRCDALPPLPSYRVKPPPASRVQVPQWSYPPASDVPSKKSSRLSKWKNASTTTP
jgi:hypothetical protein